MRSAKNGCHNVRTKERNFQHIVSLNEEVGSQIFKIPVLYGNFT